MNQSCSVVSDSLRPHGLQPTRFLCPWHFPDKNTGVGCCFVLQSIFLTQPRTRVSSVSCISKQFLYHWATLEATCLFTVEHDALQSSCLQAGNKPNRQVHILGKHRMFTSYILQKTEIFAKVGCLFRITANHSDCRSAQTQKEGCHTLYHTAIFWQ